MIRSFWAGLALFLFVLPIPGTIGLRNFTLLLLGLGTVALWRKGALVSTGQAAAQRRLFAWFTVLTLWLVLQAIWISDESSWALSELAGQWGVPLVAAIVGLGAVLLCEHPDSGLSRRQLLGGLILVLLGQTIFSLLATIPDFLSDGAFPQGKTVYTAGKLELSYWNNVLLAFLAVDGLARWLYRKALSSLPSLLLVVGILCAFVSNLAFGARNGVIGSLILLGSLVLLVLWRERGRIGVGRALGFTLAGVGLIAALAWSNYTLDSRWGRFAETAVLAWEDRDSDAWLHPEDAVLPSLPSGGPVEPSAYFRIAWIRAGIDLIAEYPLGVGYGRNAFGHALRKTVETQLGHAHSGIIDWTIGTGLPGLALWLLMLSWVAWGGMRRYFGRNDPAGLILTFVVGGFLGRMCLDSINRDHMLILFFLMLGILVSLREEPLTR